MSELSAAELRVRELLYAGAEEAYSYGDRAPVRVCCSCAAHESYGCDVPLADGTEAFACDGCNRRPECWPFGDDGPFVPLSESGAA